MNLFAYGTLLCEDIFVQVAGCRCHSSQAMLKDFRRFCIRGEEYPGLIKAPAHNVGGVIYYDVRPQAWLRLDAFEGVTYERCPVLVELADSTTCTAHTYVIRSGYEKLLSEKDWSFEHFLRTGKKRFLEEFSGFELLNERCGKNS